MTGQTNIDLAVQVGAVLSKGGEDHALAYAGRWHSWDWVSRTAEVFDRAVGDAKIVGLVARNRPHHVALCAANIANGRATAMIYSALRPKALAAEITSLRLPAVVADRQDWSDEALDAARRAGTAAIATNEASGEPDVTVLLPRGPEEFRSVDPDIGLELLSSGTTGAPKRIALPWRTVAGAVEGAAAAYAGSSTVAPQVMVHPLGNVAGLGYAVPPLAHRRPLVLLDKFTAKGWAEAVRDYRPVRGTVPPAGIRMLLDSDIPSDWLSSLTLIAVGGGKLEPELHTAFEERFGVPILLAYGATEFGGVIANWSLEDYRRLGARKRGSVGRPSPGMEIRVIDAQTGERLPSGKVGLLEARVPRIGTHWIRTTDLAETDADGFLYLRGRSDNAINRGGFKVVPDAVAAALREHPAVADAAVVGVADARLGEVPVAAVEPVKGACVDGEALIAWLKERLVAYQVPVAIRVEPELPRNESYKVSLDGVKALFEDG